MICSVEGVVTVLNTWYRCKMDLICIVSSPVVPNQESGIQHQILHGLLERAYDQVRTMHLASTRRKDIHNRFVVAGRLSWLNELMNCTFSNWPCCSYNNHTIVNNIKLILSLQCVRTSQYNPQFVVCEERREQRALRRRRNETNLNDLPPWVDPTFATSNV